MKKALLTLATGNPVGYEDMVAVKHLLQRKGWEVDSDIPELRKLVSTGVINKPVEDYDLIGFGVPYAGLHMSGKLNLTGMKDLIARAKPGALAIFAADTTLSMNPKMWDGLNSNPDKQNPYKLAPFKVIGSFSKSILDDAKAMERVNFIWMRYLHPQSTFIPIEWTSGMIDFLPGPLLGDSVKTWKNGLFEIPPKDIHSFYYGIDKFKIVSSLKKLGMGENELDAVFGPIYKKFPNIRDLSEGSSLISGRAYWTPYVKSAKRNLVPYDPVKSDHQFTKRFLELAVLNPESVVADPRIKEELLQYLTIEPWHNAANRASEELNQLF